MKGFPPGLATDHAAVFDEHHRPDLPQLFAALASDSTHIATALSRIRLSSVDLTSASFASIEGIRVLLAELNALQLDAEAVAVQADPRRAPRVAVLRSMLESGRLEVRAAPLGGWSPDFTVFHSVQGPRWLLTGHHWFDRPFPHRGPAIASIHQGDGAARAAKRYDELWGSRARRRARGVEHSRQSLSHRGVGSGWGWLTLSGGRTLFIPRAPRRADPA